DVMKAGPAETAGRRAGDVITELADGKITEVPDLQKRVAAHAPGESLTLTVVRDRNPVAVRITLGEMPSDETLVAATGAETSWGMNVEAIGPALAGRLDLARGGVVTEVVPEGPAAKGVLLEGECTVLEAGDGERALEVLRRHEVDVVMLDQRMPGEPGSDVLSRIKTLDPSVVVVLATAVREVRTAVEAIKRGAYDYITKPFDVEDIELLVRRALDKRALEREVLYLRSTLPRGVDAMIGRNVEMARIYQLIAQIAPTSATVLVTGESGTGKELVARAIHEQSPR